MLCVCGFMSPREFKKLEDSAGEALAPRAISPPSYDKARFCPVPRVPVHPLHQLNAELPEIPAEQSSVDLVSTAADLPATAETVANST
jgi:hypothetical protein